MAEDRRQGEAQAAIAKILETAHTEDPPGPALLSLARQHKSAFTHAEVYLIWSEAWTKSQEDESNPVGEAIASTLEIVAVYGPGAVGTLYNESPRQADVESARRKLRFELA